MKEIFHITSRQQWQIAQQQGRYRHPSLESEGFIHCSRVEQIIPVAHRFFAGQRDLILLRIDGDRLQSELRNDPIETGEIFPHVYGEINLEAIVEATDFGCNPQGEFQLPPTLTTE